MTRREFEHALAIALSPRDLPSYLSVAVVDAFDGFALPGFPVTVASCETFAALLRGQCVYGDGTLNATEVRETQAIARRKIGLVCTCRESAAVAA